jgi:tetratricopeptide (TPR) repeat protein
VIVLGLVTAGAAGTGIYLVQQQQDARTPAVQATPDPPPREPTTGLQAIAAYEHPTPALVLQLGSQAMWTVARDDLAAAAAHPKAPVRWRAAARLAEGQLHLVKGDAGAASEHFTAATELDKQWAAPWLGLSAARAQLADLENAQKAARAAELMLPSSWYPIAAGARALSAAGQLDDAITEYLRALPLGKDDPLLLGEIALAYHAKRLDREAEKYATAALKLDDSLLHVHLMNAERALEKRDAKRALETAERVLAIRPRHPGAHLARADAFALLHRRGDAIDSYKAALSHRAEEPAATSHDERLALVENALAKKQLPPPRGRRAPRARPLVLQKPFDAAE